MAKHLLHHPDPLNPSPSHRATLRHAAYAVLRSSFGRFWPLYLLFLLVVVSAPALLFGLLGEIELHPGEFVTEWLKLSVEGVLLFFILEIVKHRSLSSSARRSLEKFVKKMYVTPLEESIASLEQFGEALARGDAPGRTQSITAARQKWRAVEQSLGNDLVYNLPGEGDARLQLVMSRYSLDTERCDQLMKNLATHRQDGHYGPELDELLGRFRVFLAEVRSL